MKIKIVDHRIIPSPDPKRLGKKDVLQVVEVEGAGTVVVRLPQEDHSDEKLKAEIKAQMEERSKHVGREIEL